MDDEIHNRLSGIWVSLFRAQRSGCQGGYLAEALHGYLWVYKALGLVLVFPTCLLVSLNKHDCSRRTQQRGNSVTARHQFQAELNGDTLFQRG